jgi:hypothetical protein
VSEDAPVSEETTPPAETQTPEAPRSYTQEDFDRVIGRTRSEERAKFADYETLKEKAERYDEAANAAKTAEERLQEQLADRERELEQLRTSQREAVVNSAIGQAASKLGVVDLDAATKLIDRSALEFDDSGSAAQRRAAGRGARQGQALPRRQAGGVLRRRCSHPGASHNRRPEDGTRAWPLAAPRGFPRVAAAPGP